MELEKNSFKYYLSILIGWGESYENDLTIEIIQNAFLVFSSMFFMLCYKDVTYQMYSSIGWEYSYIAFILRFGKQSSSYFKLFYEFRQKTFVNKIQTPMC